MYSRFICSKTTLLHSIVILFTVSFLFGCASTFSMISVGETYKPITKVLIGSRSRMPLEYRKSIIATLFLS